MEAATKTAIIITCITLAINAGISYLAAIHGIRMDVFAGPLFLVIYLLCHVLHFHAVTNLMSQIGVGGNAILVVLWPQITMAVMSGGVYYLAC